MLHKYDYTAGQYENSSGIQIQTSLTVYFQILFIMLIFRRFTDLVKLC